MTDLTGYSAWVCDWCRTWKTVKSRYEVDHRVAVGNCDRCGQFTSSLWHMVRRPILDLLAEIE